MKPPTTPSFPFAAIVSQWVDSILLSYSSIIFSRRRSVGAIVLLATFNEPLAGFTGLIGVVIALIFSRLMHFPPELWRQGFLSFNALLCSLGVSFLFSLTVPTAPLYFLLLIAVSIISVIATVSLHGIFRAYLALPILSVPFIIVAFGLCLVTVFITGHPLAPPVSSLIFPDPSWMNHFAAMSFKSLGNLFFQNNCWAGVLVALALLVESRLSFILALMGITEGLLLLDVLTYGEGERFMGAFGFNFALTGMILGGVFLVPSIASFLYAALGIGFCVFLCAGFDSMLTGFHIPPLAIPFNIAALTMIYVLRFRTQISSPFVIDFTPGSPEQNLEYHLNRLQRYGYSSSISMRLPFLGKWTVTQPPDSEPTHQPPWQHAWDFEVTDANWKTFRNAGTELTDYFAYDLPVVAPADGTIVQAMNDVPDNPVGQFNAKQNWGNFIILSHGQNIYSLLSHLRSGSISVKPYELVKQGQLLGRCGNSGRSPVPHLHFHVQRQPHINSPTCPSQFVHYLEESAGRDTFRLGGSPTQNQKLQNFTGNESLTSLLPFSVGQELSFDVKLRDREFRESWKVQIDFYSNLFIESNQGAKLYFWMSGGIFNAVSFFGSRDCALFGFFLAGSRIPFTGSELTWTDSLPAHHALAALGKIAADVLRPFGDPLKLVSQSKIIRETSGDENSRWIVDAQLRLQFNTWTLPGICFSSQLSLSESNGILKIHFAQQGETVLEANRISPPL
jgi:urea transporter/murein DD-endopeptidase MepM/ murein hydrolase activator NlpD